MITVENDNIKIDYISQELINWKEVVDAEAIMDGLNDGSEIGESSYIVHENGYALYRFVYGLTISANCGPYDRLCYKTEI